METGKNQKRTIKVVVQAGQYEQAGEVVGINYTTRRGLVRRIRQLARQHAVYGDNWVGWIPARIAIADERRDKWYDNHIIGGRCCEPHNDWLQLDKDDPLEGLSI